MKTKLLCALAVFVFLISPGWADTVAAQKIPDEAAALSEKFTARQPLSVHTWIALEGYTISKDSGATVTTVRSDVQSRFAGQSLSAADIDALTFMVLMEAVGNMDRDLKSMVKQIQAAMAEKQVVRQLSEAQAAKTNAAATPIKPDSLSDVSETDAQRLQMAMDRRAKFFETLSDILKKISATQNTLVQNLK